MGAREVAAAVGMFWPQADPGLLRQASGAYRRAARDIASVQADCQASSRLVRAHNRGRSIEAFDAGWEAWQGRRGHLSAAIRACNELADACEAFGREVERTRHQIARLAAAASALDLGPPGRDHRRPDGHAAAVVASLVAASLAERAALTAAAARIVVAFDLGRIEGILSVGAAPFARRRGVSGQRRPRVLTYSAASRPVVRAPMAAIPAPVAIAPGAAAALPLPRAALPRGPVVHATPPTVPNVPRSTRAVAEGTPGIGLATGIERLVSSHLDRTDILVGAALGGAGAAVAGSAIARRNARRAVGTPDWAKRVRPPSQRHHASSTKDGTLYGETNGVISPEVDVQAELDAIRSGQAVYQGNQLVDDQFTLPSGRVYGVERLPDGSRMLYPVSGSGIETLSRIQMKALGIYNRFGDSLRATAALERNIRAKPADRELALRLSRTEQRPQP